jgi:hypothetical protein
VLLVRVTFGRAKYSLRFHASIYLFALMVVYLSHNCKDGRYLDGNCALTVSDDRFRGKRYGRASEFNIFRIAGQDQVGNIPAIYRLGALSTCRDHPRVLHFCRTVSFVVDIAASTLIKMYRHS